MKEIKVEGFTTDLSPDDKPAVGVYGVDTVGKTRFACTAPTPIGYIALDKKAKRTADRVADELGIRGQVVINTTPLMTNKELSEMAMSDDAAKAKTLYTSVVERVYKLGERLANSKDIESIVIDTNSQFFEWILFSHFGRRTQIKPTSRGAANQDLIDFINMLRSKNLVLIHRSKEVWKDTGAKDKDGNSIQAPSGKFEPDGFKNIGGFLTVNCEMTSKKTKQDGEQTVQQNLANKFRIRVMSCQTNALLEGQDLAEFGVSGEAITWDNLMTAIEVG